MKKQTNKTFSPVKKGETVALRIVNSIHQSILSGEITPGEKLPGQRELAKQFEASLPSVREAISILTATGVISVKPGRGTIVHGAGDAEPSFEGWLGVAHNDTEMADFLEVRELLETHIVRKVAKRSKDIDLSELYTALDSLKEKETDPGAYLGEDIAFHRLLASYSENKILEKIFLAITLPLLSQLSKAIDSTVKKSNSLRSSWLAHHDLVEAIASGDDDAAADIIKAMVNRGRDRMKM